MCCVFVQSLAILKINTPTPKTSGFPPHTHPQFSNRFIKFALLEIPLKKTVNAVIDMQRSIPSVVASHDPSFGIVAHHLFISCLAARKGWSVRNKLGTQTWFIVTCCLPWVKLFRSHSRVKSCKMESHYLPRSTLFARRLKATSLQQTYRVTRYVCFLMIQ